MIIGSSFDLKQPELWVNRGLTYGDGLFETMRMVSGSIPLFDLHMKRLAKGLKKLKLNDFNPSHVLNVLNNFQLQTSNVNFKTSSIIKLMVFRSDQARTYQPLTKNIDWLLTREDMPVAISDSTLKLAVSESYISRQPLLAGLKHLSRMEQVMLADELNNHKSADDLLVLDESRYIIETTYQNLVLIKQNQLYTPKLNHSGVQGVALQWLLDNFTVHSEHIKVKDLAAYDGMLVCNSVRGFRTVKQLVKDKKETVSFGTSHDIHDKISERWNSMYNS